MVLEARVKIVSKAGGLIDLPPQTFKTMTCDLCKAEPVYRVTLVARGTFACDTCRRPPKIRDNVNLHKKVKLDSMWVTQAQINEQDRMRILPYNGPDGSHYVGRMGENGKISERSPDFRS